MKHDRAGDRMVAVGSNALEFYTSGSTLVSVVTKDWCA